MGSFHRFLHSRTSPFASLVPAYHARHPWTNEMQGSTLVPCRLGQEGWEVGGGYMSPVNDAYRKPGLAPAAHRVAMCQAAATASPLVMVDSWESRQPQYVRTLHVLQHIQTALSRVPPSDSKPLPFALCSGCPLPRVSPSVSSSSCTVFGLRSCPVFHVPFLVYRVPWLAHPSCLTFVILFFTLFAAFFCMTVIMYIFPLSYVP